MKKLIILFLIVLLGVCTVQGQDTLEIESKLVSMLIKYETECYNDSVAITQHITSEYDKLCSMTLMWPPEINYCTNPNHKNITIYKHKEPIFKDFIVWIRKKHRDETP